MRLTRLECLLTAVIAVTVAIVVAVLWRQAGPATKLGVGEPVAPVRVTTAPARAAEASAARPERRPVSVAPRATDVAPRAVPDGARVPPAQVEHVTGGAAPHAQTPAEKAVAEWERVVDRVIAQTNAPVEIRARQVKEAFDKIGDPAKEENIRHLLNLTPDDQFDLVNEILFDKTYSENVLDAIFSDALNRPEEIKVPIMKKLILDKKHPMFFESARILDITGELRKPTDPPATTP